MDRVETYRCAGCGTEYRVLGEPTPKVTCRDCEREAALCGTAAARREYRIGYTKYREARRQLSDAMSLADDGATALARGGFDDAAADFETSVSHFTTAVREAEVESVAESAERARKKATCLWQAVEWLSGMTFASEQGERLRARQHRHDAENRLQAASEYGSLVAPDEAFPAAEAEPTA
ncbi:hypothetical protein [Haloarcula salina]|uniref:Uncharacterized protein n=1 Tax=Haloarcula salina TaxID=1429914 RepID=A0AA41G022_9EURY|nr:hypothetical protein [Haloarcula salina]MBV0901114.1 hypothetical protein [Haloarcula salina]